MKKLLLIFLVYAIVRVGVEITGIDSGWATLISFNLGLYLGGNHLQNDINL